MREGPYLADLALSIELDCEDGVHMAVAHCASFANTCKMQVFVACLNGYSDKNAKQMAA